MTSLAAILSRGIGIAAAFISVPLTVNYLGDERYGLWMTISSVIIVLGFADLGMGNGLMNAISEADGRDDHEAARKSVSSVFFMLLGIAIILLATFAMACRFIPWSRIFNVVSDIAIKEAGPAAAIFVVISIINMPLGVAQRVYMGYQEGFVPNLWGIGGNLIALGGLLVAIYFKAGLPWLVLAMSGGPVLTMLLSGIVLFGWSRPWLLPRWKTFNWSEGRKLAGVGIVFLLLQAFSLIAFYSDNLVVAQVLGASMVTGLAVTQRLFSLATLSQYFISPLWPAFGEAIARKDFAWARKTLNRILILGLGTGVIITVPLVVFGKYIIAIWVKPSLMPSTMLLAGFAVWVLLSIYIAAMSAFLNNGRMVVKQVGFYGAAAVSALILKIILTHTWQAAGVVWATVFAFGLFYVIPAAKLAYSSFRESPEKNSFD
jgi:O-antigen/teichoic acid export membrane protein